MTVGLSRTAIFSAFAGYFLDTVVEMRPALLYGDMQTAVRRRFFSDPKMYDLE